MHVSLCVRDPECVLIVQTKGKLLHTPLCLLGCRWHAQKAGTRRQAWSQEHRLMFKRRTANECRSTVAQRSGVRSRRGSSGCPLNEMSHSASTYAP